MALIDSAVDPSAGDRRRYPKVLLWGREGTGKTVTALWLAKRFRRRMFGIDADAGLAAYESDPEWRDWFRYLGAENPVTICQAMDELLTDTRGYGLFLLDPISTVWKDTQYLAEQEARRQANAKGRPIGDFTSALHKGSWTPIKRWSFFVMQRLRRIGMPVIATAREANRWRGEQVVGEKPDAEDSVPHEFDVVIRLVQATPGAQRIAYVAKDRWHRLPSTWTSEGDDPFYVARKLADAYGEHWSEAAHANPMADAAQVARLHELQSELELDSVLCLRRLRERYGVDSYEGLRPEQAGELVEILEDQLPIPIDPET